MKKPPKRDYQTLCLFVVLGGLTLALGFFLKVVLFSPVPTFVEKALKSAF